VNWFKKDSQGKFIWPGFRDNFRIIKWMMDRVNNTVQAKDTPIGLMPDYKDIDFTGLDISKEIFDKLFEVKTEDWRREIQGIEEFYSQFDERLPKELINQLDELKKRIM
jgi:phosphoenolpyruvate carboxykinase (GTP)